jgi:hypothetical protein
VEPNNPEIGMSASRAMTDPVKINYQPFDPDSVDLPVISVLLETSGKRMNCRCTFIARGNWSSH